MVFSVKKQKISLLLILLFLLSLPNLFILAYMSNLGVIIWINNILLISCILLFFNTQSLRFFGFILLLVFVVNNGLSVFSLVYYNGFFNTTMALNFLTTNAKEALEMIWEFKFVFLIGILYFVSLYVVLIRLIKSKVSFIPLSIGIALLLLYPAKKTYTLYTHNEVNFSKIGGQSLSIYLTMTPFSAFCPFIEANSLLHTIKSHPTLHNYPPFETKNTNLENIIVVLGESARRDALHLYGNKEQTTPYIENRLNNLLIYNQAIAPSSFTNTAVTLLLSKQLPSENFNLEANTDHIIALANASSIWNTYWLSAQERAGIYVNLFTPICEQAHYKHWIQNSQYDEDVLKPFQDIIHNSNKNRLIFIHLMGSHTRVTERYPQNFAVFQSNYNHFINEYNNSILYTDYVLDQIIQQVESTKSIVIYVADHGQSIENKSYKHSFTQKGVEIPFFIWHSDSVDDDLKKTGRIQAPISSTNLYNILSDYMGILGLSPKDSNSELKVLTPSIALDFYSNMPPGK